jgi:ribosomal protein S18 acetylase RimI-like enzyme
MKIIRIKKVNNELITQINQLFDDMEWDIKEGKKFLANKDNLLLLAYENNIPVGFLTAHRLQRFDKRKAEILLYEIGVNQDFRRKGIGKSLIEEVKKWAKKVDADEVWVLTEKTNPAAIAAYQSAGGVEESPGTIMFVYKI